MGQTFLHLDGHQYMSLTTYRKNGDAVPTPVWFAQVGDHLYVTTAGSSGKVKRLRNNGLVSVAPCTSRGETLGESAPAQGRIIEDPAIQQVAQLAIKRKYGLMYRLITGMGAITRLFTKTPPSERVFLVISPL